MNAALRRLLVRLIPKILILKCYNNYITLDPSIRSLKTSQDLALKVATPIGTVIGQIMFGWLADVLGRKRMCRMFNVFVSYGHLTPSYVTRWNRNDDHRRGHLCTDVGTQNSLSLNYGGCPKCLALHCK